MSAKMMERFEILFRRQLALEWTVSARTRVIRRIDPVGPAGRGGIAEAEALPPAQPAGDTAVRTMPGKTLQPSSGWYNVARIPENCAVWLIVVDVKAQADFRDLLMSVCNIQSMRRNFRPVFALPDERNIELMRQFGLSFEVLTDPGYGFGDIEEQLAHISTKWGVSMRLDIADANLIGDGRAAKPTTGANAATAPRRSGRAPATAAGSGARARKAGRPGPVPVTVMPADA